MYISRIRLDTSKRSTQLALASPGKIHGAVETAFPVRQTRNLWRIDRIRDDLFLLIVSHEQPEMSGISSQFGFKEDRGESKKYDGYLAGVINGTRWRFRLTANPTISRRKDAGRGTVSAHVSARYQMQWLEKKGLAHGFELITDAVEIVSDSWKSFYRKDNGRKVQFREVTFEGILTVTDENLFRDALVNGIGREKAFGMGMITVIRS